MQRLIILNSRKVKKIHEMLKNQFSATFTGDYVYLQNQKDKVFLVTRAMGEIDLDKLRVDRYGLYVGEVQATQFRLSKEGAQLLARENKKLTNVVEISHDQVKEYYQGMNLDIDLGENKRLVLLKFKDQILGCSMYREGKLLNYLPKAHRGEVII